MVQAPLLEGVLFDLFALFQDVLATSEVDIGRSEITKALMIAPVVVMVDEGLDLVFQVPGQEVVLKQDPVFEGLVSSFDFALCLGMVGSSTRMFHALTFQPMRQVVGEVTWPVVGQELRPLPDLGFRAA